MLVLVVLVLLGALASGVEGGACTQADRAVWQQQGHTWAHQFRDYGGLWVSKSSFERQVRAATGLSEACAACYGEAYICGYDHCKWSCYSENEGCTTCLRDEGCTERCNTCTGFQ